MTEETVNERNVSEMSEAEQEVISSAVDILGLTTTGTRAFLVELSLHGDGLVVHVSGRGSSAPIEVSALAALLVFSSLGGIESQDEEEVEEGNA